MNSKKVSSDIHYGVKIMPLGDLIKQALSQYTQENNLTKEDFINLRQVVKDCLKDLPTSKDKNLLEYKTEIENIKKKIECILTS